MPKEAFGSTYRFLPRSEILTFEEIIRVVAAARRLGVRKVRLTGGEPLLRHDAPALVHMLAREEGLDLALTTNGSLLAEQAPALAAAGLRRLNVSLDSLDDAVFRAMNDVDFPVARVLDGLAAAERAGLGPLKVNCVVRRGINDHTMLDLARRFRGTGTVVRFIEFMDVGNSNGWRLDEVVPARQILARLAAEFPLEPLAPTVAGEVAERWRYRDGAGEIGVIASVTQPFCGDCTRLRLSADGHLFTCLFATAGTDLRPTLRGAGDDEALVRALAEAWRRRADRYSEERALATLGGRKAEMSYLGG
jgi:cyclic pyranopterin phosphate synthase